MQLKINKDCDISRIKEYPDVTQVSLAFITLSVCIAYRITYSGLVLLFRFRTVTIMFWLDNNNPETLTLNHFNRAEDEKS